MHQASFSSMDLTKSLKTAEFGKKAKGCWLTLDNTGVYNAHQLWLWLLFSTAVHLL